MAQTIPDMNGLVSNILSGYDSTETSKATDGLSVEARFHKNSTSLDSGGYAEIAGAFGPYLKPSGDSYTVAYVGLVGDRFHHDGHRTVGWSGPNATDVGPMYWDLNGDYFKLSNSASSRAIGTAIDFKPFQDGVDWFDRVVGELRVTSTATPRPFTWVEGQLTNVAQLLDVSTYDGGVAEAIGTSGLVAGHLIGASGNPLVTWSPSGGYTGSPSLLTGTGYLSGRNYSAVDVGDSDKIYGYVEPSSAESNDGAPFVYTSSSGYTYLPAGVYGRPRQASHDGIVVGNSPMPWVWFSYNPGAPVDLQAFFTPDTDVSSTPPTLTGIWNSVDGVSGAFFGINNGTGALIPKVAVSYIKDKLDTSSFHLALGAISLGNASSLKDADGDVLRIAKFLVPNATTPPIDYDVVVPPTSGNPTGAANLWARVTARAMQAGLFAMTVTAWDWSANGWSTTYKDTYSLSTHHQTFDLDLSAGTSVVRDATTGNVMLRVQVMPSGPVVNSTYTIEFDQTGCPRRHT